MQTEHHMARMDTPYLNFRLLDEPAIVVTTGRGEAFFFCDDPARPVPDMTDLGRAVLVTRLRYWADLLSEVES